MEPPPGTNVTRKKSTDEWPAVALYLHPFPSPLPLISSLFPFSDPFSHLSARAARPRRRPQAAAAEDARGGGARSRRRTRARPRLGCGGGDARGRGEATAAEMRVGVPRRRRQMSAREAFLVIFFFVILGFYSLGLNVVI